MTRPYRVEEEQRVRVLDHVRDWARAGLLDASQAAAIETRIRTDLRRTNVFLRAGLALFTAVIAAASVGLVFVSFGISGRLATTLTFSGAAVVCFAAAEYLIAAFRVYRHGIEEACAAAGVVLLGLSAAAWTETSGLPMSNAVPFAIATLASFWVYRRFGFVYAALAAMACMAVALSELRLAQTTQRLVTAGAFAAIYVVARAAYLRHGDDFPGDDYALVQAAAFAGMYLFINVRLFDVIGPAGAKSVVTWFYWTSYAGTWLIPVGGLLLAIRGKDRPLLTVSLVLAFATLATNKPYLGLPRESWDPILFGVLLVVTATLVRRWLARGPGGQRAGFTAEKIFERDRDWLRTVATASVAWPHDMGAARPSEPAPSPFEGGRSGGGGGGAQY